MISCKFRESMPLDGKLKQRGPESVRIVPPFSVQSYQSNTQVANFKPKCGPKKCQPVSTDFRRLYENGEIPVAIDPSSQLRKIIWFQNANLLDQNYYLPIFFEGLLETTYPYDVLANQGSLELLRSCRGESLNCLPLLTFYIRKAFLSDNPAIVINACSVLQALVLSGAETGESMVKYYKKILIPLSRYKDFHVMVSDTVKPVVKRDCVVSRVVLQTLQILDIAGSDDAYEIIHNCIPTYDQMSRLIINTFDY